jgi:hypothetical protein
MDRFGMSTYICMYIGSTYGIYIWYLHMAQRKSLKTRYSVFAMAPTGPSQRDASKISTLTS